MATEDDGKDFEMKDGKYNIWTKKTREWIGVGASVKGRFSATYVPSEYIAERIEEHEYPKCPEADGWFIVKRSAGGPIIRRRIGGDWYYASGQHVDVPGGFYTILREIDPL